MKKILVVEDEADLAKAIKIRLELNGFQVSLAEDGNSVLEEVKKQKPDLILLDLMLPMKDGFTVCNNLKNDEKYRGIPIIILSARNEEVDIELGTVLGADLYITKPFDYNQLISKINELLVKSSV